MSRPAAVASGYIPFVICTLLTVIFSSLYILWFRSTRRQDKSRTTTTISIISLIVTLLAGALVPVDVFLVSCMKNSNGTYKEWAEDEEVRRSMSDRVKYTYYVFYGLILAFLFFVLPQSFFFHAIGDEDDPDDDEFDDEQPREESCSKRFCRAFKYTLASLLLFGLLVALGMLIPFSGDNPHKEFDLVLAFLGKQYQPNRGEDLLLFLLNVLNGIGMLLLIKYTGYGMCTLPCGMIVGSDTIYTELSAVVNRIVETEGQVRELRAECGNGEGASTENERSRLEKLDKELRLLNRTKHELEQTSKSFVNRCILICRPFQLVFGAFFTLVGFLVFLSLTLTSIDKAINSMGARDGYVLLNATLPNPLDTVLVYAQSVYPLDYLVYCGMILFFVFSSMAGIKEIGIRFMWLSVYKIRVHKTKPQAIVLMCMNLMFILLALNVVMYSVVPDYTTYGSQHYVVNSTVLNETVHTIKKCSLVEAPPTMCDMTRFAVFLVSFSSNAWIFGAAYYWLIWGFLLSILVGSVYVIVKLKRPGRRPDPAEDVRGLMDEDAVFNSG